MSTISVSCSTCACHELRLIYQHAVQALGVSTRCGNSKQIILAAKVMGFCVQADARTDALRQIDRPAWASVPACACRVPGSCSSTAAESWFCRRSSPSNRVQLGHWSKYVPPLAARLFRTRFKRGLTQSTADVPFWPVRSAATASVHSMYLTPVSKSVKRMASVPRIAPINSSSTRQWSCFFLGMRISVILRELRVAP